MKLKKWTYLTIFVMSIIILTGCAPAAVAPPAPAPSALPSGSLIQSALDVVVILKNQDMTGLSTFVDPVKGIRFTPYAYIDTATNLVFTSAQISTLLTDTNTHLWGSYDGTGDPIQLTPQNYYDKFVYDVDFASPNLIGNNVIIGTGNTTNNMVQAYPGASYVEFHFTGFDPQYAGMDWKSLRLVFEKTGGIWYLVGIVHDQWTI